MKEKWTTPRTVIEEFTPNEYVAACWGVACNWSAANAYEEDHPYKPDPVSHASDACGLSSSQYLVDSDGDDTPDAMYEASKELGKLRCTVYADGNYTQIVRDLSQIKVNDYIYWTTSSGPRVWHHQGWVKATVPGKPNMS